MRGRNASGSGSIRALMRKPRKKGGGGSHILRHQPITAVPIATRRDPLTATVHSYEP